MCQNRGMSYLVYGKYTYGNKVGSHLAEFKRRNGFEQIDFPVIYSPNPEGATAFRFKLHRDLGGLLPPGIVVFLITVPRRFENNRTICEKIQKSRGRFDGDQTGKGNSVNQQAGLQVISAYAPPQQYFR